MVASDIQMYCDDEIEICFLKESEKERVISCVSMKQRCIVIDRKNSANTAWNGQVGAPPSQEPGGCAHHNDGQVGRLMLGHAAG